MTRRRRAGSTRAVGATVLVAALLAGCAASPSTAGRDDAADDAPTAADTLVVGAAADLRPAFERLGERFERETGAQVELTFGSSGQLAQQLTQGAPIDLYASADAGYVDRVLDAGVGDEASRRTYATGRIVVWSQAREHVTADLQQLAERGPQTLAIANPEHAPYGRAAREALTSAGVWQQLEPALVYGENIADTQRIAAGGDAEVAILALSLALAAEPDGHWQLLDEQLHAPLQQDLLITAEDPGRAELAARFIDLLADEEGRALMRRYGFVPPGEEPPASWETQADDESADAAAAP